MYFEEFVSAIKEGGVKAFIINLIGNLLLLLAGVIFLTYTLDEFSPVQILSGYPDVNQLTNTPILALGFGFINGAIYLLLFAGMLGCFKDLQDEKEVSVSTFLSNLTKYGLRTIGYAIIYFIAIVLILAIPVTIVADLLMFSQNVVSIIYIFTILVGLFIYIVIAPRFIFNIFNLNYKGFTKMNLKPLFIYSLLLVMVAIIPYIGSYLSYVLLAFYTLYILILYKHNPPLANS